MSGFKNVVAEIQEDVISQRIRIADLEIDSFFESAPHDAKPLWFLGKSFECLSNADVVVFGKGWKDKRGCKMENLAVKEYLPNAIVIEL